MVFMVVLTIVSIALAATMTAIAWHLIREERRRSDARVAALAADIHGGPSGNPAADIVMNEPPHVAVGDLFAASEVETSARRPRLLAVAGAGALVVVALGAALVFATGGSHRGSSAPRPAGATAAAAAARSSPASVPLELVALVHEREDDRLTVRGIVRNPSTGQEVSHLTAVVLLFNQQGGFLTSGRATLDTPALAPGTEAPFAITVPGATDVGRYRVSFRTDDRVIPHVDRRT